MKNSSCQLLLLILLLLSPRLFYLHNLFLKGTRSVQRRPARGRSDGGEVVCVRGIG